MRRLRTILGITIVITGLVMMSLYTYPYSSKTSSYIEVEKKWSISQDLNQSVVLGMSFRPDADWSIYTPLIYTIDINGTLKYAKWLEIKVTNPQSNYTIIRVAVLIATINGGASALSLYPDHYEVFNKTTLEYITVKKNGFSDPTGGLIIEKGYPRIDTVLGDNVFQLGKPTMPGLYNLTCTLDPEVVNDLTNENVTWVHKASPPPTLRFYQTIINTYYPYALLLPIGAPISVLGLVVAVWGIRRKRNPRHASTTGISQNVQKNSA